MRRRLKPPESRLCVLQPVKAKNKHQNSALFAHWASNSEKSFHVMIFPCTMIACMRDLLMRVSKTENVIFLIHIGFICVSLGKYRVEYDGYRTIQRKEKLPSTFYGTNENIFLCQLVPQFNHMKYQLRKSVWKLFAAIESTWLPRNEAHNHMCDSNLVQRKTDPFNFIANNIYPIFMRHTDKH